MGTQVRRRLRRSGVMRAACLAAVWAGSALVPSTPAQTQHGWVAETPRFRVLVQDAPGLDGEAALAAAGDLEAIRRHFLAEGLGEPPRADGPLEFLIVASKLDLHRLLRDPPSSTTRAVTIRGLDRDFSIVPWHDRPGPRTVLAHEYAHHVEAPGWPPWFREGRAVYLARRIRSEPGVHPVAGLIPLLDRAAWIAWPELLSADRGGPAASEGHFQAQSWLLVHWLAGRLGGIVGLAPRHGGEALSALGGEGLDGAVRAHLDGLRLVSPETSLELVSETELAAVRPAQPWELPLFEAEAHTALRKVGPAFELLAALAERFPAVARVLAASGALELLRGRLEFAEAHYRWAVLLGDERARTAYRLANLLMLPGEVPVHRAAEALRHALRARDGMPREPAHRLSVVHAYMLVGDWRRAFRELSELAKFPGWQSRARREAREVRRRHGAGLRFDPPPPLRAAAPAYPELPAPALSPPPLPRVRASSDRGADRRWPPYGAWLTHGRVAWVDCSADGKRVIVHSPYKRYVFRENPRRQPRLINRPFREHELPCGARGWQVAVAYRKGPSDGDTDGELVGLRF